MDQYEQSPTTVRSQYGGPGASQRVTRIQTESERVLNAYSDTSWQQEARCAEVGSEIFFPETGDPSLAARKVCGGCEVREACLDYALKTNQQHGIWGGLSPNQRARLRSGKPTARQLRDQKIVELHAQGHSSGSLATQFGLSERTIMRITNTRSPEIQAA